MPEPVPPPRKRWFRRPRQVALWATVVVAASVGAVAIMAPIGLGFAAKYKINPLMMGMLIVHGAQAGGFSPIAVYGVIVNSLIADTGFAFSPMALFLSSLLFNFAIDWTLVRAGDVALPAGWTGRA